MNTWQILKVFKTPLPNGVKELCIGRYTQEQVNKMPKGDSSMYSIMENLNNTNPEPNVKYYYIVVHGKPE